MSSAFRVLGDRNQRANLRSSEPNFSRRSRPDLVCRSAKMSVRDRDRRNKAARRRVIYFRSPQHVERNTRATSYLLSRSQIVSRSQMEIVAPRDQYLAVG